MGAAVAAGAFAGAMVAPIAQWHDAPRTAFDDTLRIDAFGNGARLLIFAAGLLAVVVAWGMPHLADRAVEYHALLLAAAAGMSLLAVSNSLVIAFIALELFSIALYVLVAIDVDALPGLEGALKYLVVGSVGAAFLLYGSALVYGATGQFEFDLIAQSIRHGDAHGGVLLLGIAMIIVGLGFKANSAPVPHVDAGRVRGSAHTGDRVHVGGHQDGGAGADVPRAGGSLRRGLGDLAGRDRSARGRVVRGRQPGGPAAGEREADAGLLHDRSHRASCSRRWPCTPRRPRAPCSTTWPSTR